MGTTVINGDFGKNLGKWAMKHGKTVEQTIKRFGVKMLEGIVKDTPVDTGRLRGNWQTSAGTPIFTPIDRESEAQAVQQISQNFNPLGVTYMTNNLPYAKRRNEEGGARYKTKDKKGKRLPRPEGVAPVSKENPNLETSGFIEKNMARMERTLAEAVKNVKG